MSSLESYTLFSFDSPKEEKNLEPTVLMQAPLNVGLVCLNYLAKCWVEQTLEKDGYYAVGMSSCIPEPQEMTDKNGEPYNLPLPPRVTFLASPDEGKEPQNIDHKDWTQVKWYSAMKTKDFDLMFANPKDSTLNQDTASLGDWDEEAVAMLCQQAEEDESPLLHTLSWEYQRMGRAKAEPVPVNPSLN